jgi:hypothetical protein
MAGAACQSEKRMKGRPELGELRDGPSQRLDTQLKGGQFLYGTGALSFQIGLRQSRHKYRSARARLSKPASANTVSSR